MTYYLTPRDALRFLRDAGWTMQELADIVGVTKSSISRIHTGTQRPHRDTANKIFELADKEADRLSGVSNKLNAYCSGAR